MKTRNILVALCALAFATSLAAQTTYLRADIPFQFYVGDKLMPAGHYSLLKVNETANVLQLDDSTVTRFFVTFGAQRNSSVTDPTLVFRHIGNLYFLSKIWDGGGPYGRELAVSKVRAELAQKNYPTSDAIIILARK